jgi:phage-related protein
MQKFEIRLLKKAVKFLESLEVEAKSKLLINIEKAQISQDIKLFKKLQDDIWEFRARVGNNQYRMLAFWDKRNNQNVLVICTHGFIKKTSEVPKQEIETAIQIKRLYLETS